MRRPYGFANRGTFGAGKNRDLGMFEEVQRTNGILYPLIERNVAADDRQCQHIQLGCPECEHDSEGIDHAWIYV